MNYVVASIPVKCGNAFIKSVCNNLTMWQIVVKIHFVVYDKKHPGFVNLLLVLCSISDVVIIM